MPTQASLGRPGGARRVTTISHQGSYSVRVSARLAPSTAEMLAGKLGTAADSASGSGVSGGSSARTSTPPRRLLHELERPARGGDEEGEHAADGRAGGQLGRRPQRVAGRLGGHRGEVGNGLVLQGSALRRRR